jgi:tetratricopeptide (TPR) repeat protein
VKESAVAVPAALMLWRATDPSRPAGVRDLLRISALHWLALFVALAAALALPAYRHLLATSLATRTPGENLVAQVHAVLYLLGQIVRIDRLNADPALPAITQLDPKGLLGAVVLVAIPVLAFAKRRRAPIAAFAILWTALWLLPTNSLLARLDLVNDRQAYGALVGPALLVALGLRALAARSRSGLALAGLALVVLSVGLGVATHRRNAIYGDEVVFWQAVIEASPGNARAFNNLGIALAARCDEAGAIRAWRQALALDPAFVRAAVNLRLALEGAAPSSESDCPESPISR